MRSTNKNVNFVKNIIDLVFYIFLIFSIIVIFLEEFFFYIGSSYNTIFFIKIVNLIIDIILFCEFIIKFVKSLLKNRAKNYILHKNGWTSLFASLLPLLFVSIPFFLNEIIKVNLPFLALEYLVSLRIMRFFRVLRF